MHELSMAMELVAQVGEIARREGAARIARIEVSIGALSGVDSEAFDPTTPADPASVVGLVPESPGKQPL